MIQTFTKSSKNITDDFLDFYVVLEANTDANEVANKKIDLLEVNEKDGILHYLRFNAIIHTFNGRNRNRRLWVPKFVKDAMKLELFLDKLKNGLGGEAGHPVPLTGDPTIERIMTIDPNFVSHILRKFWWEKNDTELHAEIETLDDGNGPGDKLARFIRQGYNPAWSCRAVIPQRKNLDGSTDQTGVGVVVTYDRVYGPSCPGAYKDDAIPVKEIANKTAFEKAMESAYTASAQYAFSNSKKVNRILDNMCPVMESVGIDANSMVHVKNTDGDTLIIPTEKDIRMDIKKFMSKF